MDNECVRGTHEFVTSKTGYYKKTGEVSMLRYSVYDQSVSYATLYCRRCGTTKEIIHADYRKKVE